ncbi:MAG: hypothetical protein JRJ15_02195 [Deltaproteobacteria bacterium]|nr:hypothetical protein [Deltaproteobacteria bacterium]
MKELKKEMKTVLRDLKLLTKKTERLAAKLDKLEKAAKATAKRTPAKKTATKKAPAKKAPAKKAPAKKAQKTTASDTILNIIKKSKNPIDTATLKKRTAFKDNNIRMIVYRLKKRGEIKSVSKGIYKKA